MTTQSNPRHISSPGSPNCSDIIKHYEILMDRTKHEGQLIWIRFSAFFIIVAGLFVGYTLLFLREELQIDQLKYFAIRDANSIGIAFCLIGTITAFFWFLANLDGRYWQLVLHDIIKTLEDNNPHIFRGVGFGSVSLYQYQGQEGLDVVDIAILISALSSSFWLWLLMIQLSQGIVIQYVPPLSLFLCCMILFKKRTPKKKIEDIAEKNNEAQQKNSADAE